MLSVGVKYINWISWRNSLEKSGNLRIVAYSILQQFAAISNCLLARKRNKLNSMNIAENVSQIREECSICDL